MIDPDPELLEIFREETDERLDRIETTLRSLASGGDGDEAMESLFREVHSIKGNAGMVGFHEAEMIARAMTDVLEEARRSGELPPALAAPLLEQNDSIRRAVRDAQAGADASSAPREH